MKQTLHVQYIVIVLRIKVNNIFSICKCICHFLYVNVFAIFNLIPYFGLSLSNYVLQFELLRCKN